MPVDVLVGGQYGSEGKGGLLAKLLAEDPRRWNTHIRVGAANAGHTGYDLDGRKHVALQLPLACHIAPNSHILGVIGAGALVSLDILADELQHIRDDGGDPFVIVDAQAHVIQEHHKVLEAQAGLEQAIGSASTIAKEGIGQAELARVARIADNAKTARQCKADLEKLGITVAEMTETLNWDSQEGERILIEGTQGFGLSLYHGQWPYVTSRDTTTAGLLSQTGLSPRELDQVYGVYRTYPIRVHGNSGPFYDGSEEKTWEELGLEPEMTTVTKRVRRVATFSWEQFRYSLRINGVTQVCLTFWDYLDPLAMEILKSHEVYTPEEGPVREFLNGLGRECQYDRLAQVCWVSVGPRPLQMFRVSLTWKNNLPMFAVHRPEKEEEYEA